MEEDYVMIPGSGTKKIIRDVKKEIETAFLDYSMSVIVSRALPDVRDGLKPVHRRILYTMHERGNDPSHAYRKSADTVGAVLGSYHPHGDASVYDAMVRLAQDFSLRYPLVDGQGNFGSVDGDPPAAYRYTEARMSRMAVEMLTDIEKDTIDWDPNFDETKKEPSVLPCRFPNLLVNGSQGIAVGMATNIPPHNLSEVIDGCIAYIDDPDIDLPGLMEHIKGPDFPTAGIIMGRSGIRAAYAKQPPRRVPCHNDALAENFMLQGEQMRVIDWEYGGMNDGYYDIACVCVENPLDARCEDVFFRAYCGGEPSEEAKARLLINKFLVTSHWSTWSLVQICYGKDADFYWEYGRTRAVQACSFLDDPSFSSSLTLLGG